MKGNEPMAGTQTSDATSTLAIPSELDSLGFVRLNYLATDDLPNSYGTITFNNPSVSKVPPITSKSLCTGDDFDFALLVYQQRLIPEADIETLQLGAPKILVISISYFLPGYDTPRDLALRQRNPEVPRGIGNDEVTAAIIAQLNSAGISSTVCIIPTKL